MLPQKIYCRAQNETLVSDLEDKNKRKISKISIPASLAGMACCLAGSANWSWDLELSDEGLNGVCRVISKESIDDEDRREMKAAADVLLQS